MKKLEQLYELRLELEALAAQHQIERDHVLGPVAVELRVLEQNLDRQRDVLTQQIEMLEASIKHDVLELGKSVKAKHLQAVFQAGRVTWDGKALDGFAAAHPEIKEFRRVGRPSVSIRASAAAD